MVKLFAKQGGSFSIISIWTVLAVSLLTLMLYSLAQSEVRMAVSFRDGVQARFTAEAGTRYAIYKLAENPNWQPATGGYLQTIDLPAVTGKYTITVKSLPDRTIEIQTIGQVNQSKRKVSATFNMDDKTVAIWDSN
ncbi:hypothetical protein [Acetonema longum]|uniref:Type 4 fimbrial biogenesis protein PilX N-terminal domain-containing protein n=1 Tax=Acetonema longum DSM 6540 TaxID=1009370 RepID=F7NPR5_9FIRM|nr:hypothetical protein [Acetonema longum]EGO61906.1 hypothetical protein ALO_20562 [Acetonema longum DSM 6540]